MKKGIDKSGIISVAGVGLSLLALIIIFSSNTIFDFLITAIVRPFGFVGFWILLPFFFILGLYMLLKQKLVKFKLGLSLWGILIIIFSFLILTSVWAAPSLNPDVELNFGTVSTEFISRLVDLDKNYFNTQLGGGVVGYFLAGSLNSAITYIGTQIVCWVLAVIGLCLIFNKEIKRLFVYIRSSKKRNRTNNDNSLYRDLANDYKEEEISEPLPKMELNPRPIFDNEAELDRFSNSNNSLKKAQFSFDDSEEITLETPTFSNQNNSFSSPSFGEDESTSFTKPVLNDEPIYEEEDIPEDYNEFSPSLAEYDSLNQKEESVNIVKPQPTLASAPTLSTPMMNVVTPQVPAQPVAPQPEPVVDKLHRPQPKANPIKNYIYPPIDLLDYHESSEDAEKNVQSTQETIDKINQVFEQLHIGAQVVGSTVGPAVTRYDVQTNSNVSVNQVARYVEDISIRLGGVSTRFEKIVAGRATSGLEIPNAIRTSVGLRESIEKLPSGPKNLRFIPFGKNISGELLSGNLSDFPHMLVSGTTGSGKTIFMHSVILSLIMRNRPDELKIVLIDPKKVEMAYYEKIPHLLCPNISQSQKAYVAMKKLVDEMERRYNIFADNRVRDIKGFNEWANSKNIQPLPYIVVFIDEYADLVEEVKDIRTPVVRIAQKARAAGIHLVIATQRPSVNVIDGVIKANVSTRVALMVASQVDSVSVIGQGGAETLLGNGDMIVDCPLLSKSLKPRVQGCFVDVPEINRVCDFLRNHYPEQYDSEFLDLEERDESANFENGGEVPVIDKDMAEEQLYTLIKEQIMERDYCSISYIQRTYQVGFPKAGRLFNKLINDGYVARSGDARGSKVLIRSSNNEQQMGTIEQSTFIPDNENN